MKHTNLLFSYTRCSLLIEDGEGRRALDFNFNLDREDLLGLINPLAIFAR